MNKYLLHLIVLFLITLPTLSQGQVVDVQVSNSADDAEQRVSSGSMNLTSSDLELCNDGQDQLVGMLFRNVNVPLGAVITAAHLEFETDETGSGTTTVSIVAQDADNPADFSTTAFDISDRSTTPTSVSWNIPAWTTVSEKHQSPDISLVIQDVVNRTGWAANNNMAIIISGTGTRTAESYNGESANAPKLHIEYNTSGYNFPPTAQFTYTLSCLEATFTDASTDSDGTIVSWSWDFGDGNTSALQNPVHTYAAAGTYPVQLTVTDDGGATNSTSQSISVVSSTTYYLDDDADGYGDPNSSTTACSAPSGYVTDNTDCDDTDPAVNPGATEICDDGIDNDCDGVIDGCVSAVDFAVIGDFGDPDRGEPDVADMVNGWDIDLITTTGDNRYGIGYDEAIGQFYCQWLKDVESGSFCSGGTSSVNAFFPSLGNHDYDDDDQLQGYLDYFDLPGNNIPTSGTSGNERYYDVIQGSVHFFFLDSEAALIDPAEMTAQKDWLQTELGNSTAAWQVVTLHHPPISSKGGENSLRWPYATWGADVLLTGHSHYYERLEINGIPYIVNGLGGAAITTSVPSPIPESQVIYADDYGAMIFNADINEMHLQFIDISGTVIDDHTLTSSPPPPPSGPIVDVQISNGSDDVEQRVSSGNISMTSSDLELCFDNQDQLVGLLFRNIDVPQGATITSAYLEFETDETGSSNTILSIAAHDTDNAADFTMTAYDVSDRPTTSAAVSWDVPAWTTVNEKHQSPDISSVIQEVIDRTGWAANNEMAIIISGTGTGKRTAESYDGESANAPILHIEYDTGTNNTPPTAQFTYTLSCLEATFTDASTDSDGTIVSWSWDFGDGNTSTLQNPVHTYAAAGTYPVQLTVTDDGGATNSTSQSISVVSSTTYYLDDDADGYGDPNSSTTACSAPSGYVPDNTDCDDTDPAVNPGATEICDDGIDNDCDGVIDGCVLTADFAIIGDFGDGSTNELDVANLVNGWDIDFVTTTGDNRYGIGFDEAIGQYYCQWLKDVESGSYCNGGTSPINAFFPTVGNHDYDDGNGIDEYLDYFTLPGTNIPTSGTSGNELYYDVIQGPIHFFFLDSDKALDDPAYMSAQQSWLQTELGNSTAAWKLVYLHHPPYSSTGNRVSLQWNYALWGADVVLTGHHHHYERLNSDGIVYFVNGVGGASVSPVGPPIPESQFLYNDDFGAMKVIADTGQIEFQFYDVSGALIDDTTLTHSTPPPSNPFVDVQISNGSDDVEQRVSDGNVNMTSSDLELCFDSQDQLVGLLFRNIDVPQGTTITSAYLEFETDESGSSNTILSITAHDTDNAADFTTTAYDVSDRPTTSAAVSWDVPAWNAVNEKHQSPDISSVIQEVINRTGWAANNEMAIIISGTGAGKRTAESYDGESVNAPILHIEYDTGSNNTPPTAQFTYSLDCQDATFTDTSTDPEGPIASWAWDFGDGNTSTDQNPVHTYASGGSFTVELTVTDGDGATNTTSQSIVVTSLSTYYLDLDEDGYGDPANPTSICSADPPSGFVADNTDCDDTDPNINPGATEICDGIDNNCDGQIDEGVKSTFYADTDNDNYGDANNTTEACTVPSGYVTDNTDCDDTDPNIYPGATEICDGIDNDCDGQIDEGVQSTFYADTDNDGYGDANNTTEACTAPTGYVTDNTDCDDTRANVYPGATEICDGLDNDCDGLIDEGVLSTFYADTDDDGYGDAGTTTEACTAPTGFVTDNTDCDDTRANVYPGAPEICDELDNDCDGLIDEDGLNTFYADTDDDGYGDAGTTTEACFAPAGYVADNTDCDDTDPNINPGVTEICDGIDNNCDGQIDEGVLITFYADTDNDGYGDAGTNTEACTAPTGFVADNTDCDDTDPNINPGVTEICDGIDNNCDGQIDEGVLITFYADTDNDGYGDAGTNTEACTAPTGYVADNTDCDDTDPNINPGVTEICDGIDNNCDGQIDEGVLITFYADTDNDGYGDAGTTTEACTAPTGFVTDNTDCDDTDPNINPGVTEICDGIDNDCDGIVDNNCGGCTYEVINSESFEAGFGIWVDGGNDCSLSTSNPNTGSYSVDIQDNSGDASSFSTNDLDLTNYDEVTIDFSFYTVSMESGEDFWLSISTDGGSTYSIVEDYIRNTDFANNTRYNESVLIDNITFTSTTRFKFTCDASSNTDDVYIDDVVINGCLNANANATPTAQFNYSTSCLEVTFTDTSTDPEGPISSWAWDFGDGNTSTDQNPVHTYATVGTYTVELTVTDNEGATNSISQSITVTSALTYYQDADADGYGDPATSTTACSAPSGYVTDNTDCDDTDPAINPGAVEDCDDGIDNNCDGLIDNCASCTYQVINSESFEAGFGIWIDGGDDCFLSTSNPNTGSYSVDIQDNSGDASSFSTNDLDLSNYEEVTIDFSFFTVSMESGEDFWLSISTDGGNTYTIVKDYIRNIDFVNNTRYNESVVIDNITFTSTTRFKFTCDASYDTDDVYIDDVVINGCLNNFGGGNNNNLILPGTNPNGSITGVPIPAERHSIQAELDFDLYPVPTSERLTIEFETDIEDVNLIRIVSLSGKVVMEISEPIEQIMTLDVSHLTAGLYHVNVFAKSQQKVAAKRFTVN